MANSTYGNKQQPPQQMNHNNIKHAQQQLRGGGGVGVVGPNFNTTDNYVNVTGLERTL